MGMRNGAGRVAISEIWIETFASFPLTLTLSLGEREQPSTRSERSGIAGFVTASWLLEEGMVVLQLNSGVSRTQRTILPLPEGEGRGEGEAYLLIYAGVFRIMVRLVIVA